MSLKRSTAPGIRVAGLQLDHQATGAVGELFGLVEALLGGAVEVFQVRQLVAGDRVFLQVGHQHAELGAPVAHVVLADHFVAEELQHPGHAVADDGRAQVADVHLLGQVRRRQVDHRALRRAGLAHADVASARAASRRVARAWVFWKKLRKPGPAISALLTFRRPAARR
jgi:hypothetical protein